VSTFGNIEIKYNGVWPTELLFDSHVISQYVPFCQTNFVIKMSTRRANPVCIGFLFIRPFSNTTMQLQSDFLIPAGAFASSKGTRGDMAPQIQGM
jgi:hypothetical protein